MATRRPPATRVRHTRVQTTRVWPTRIQPATTVLTLLALVAALLSGCADGPSGDGGPADGDDAGPALSGVVADPAVRPLEGVVVTLASGPSNETSAPVPPMSATTRPDGSYAFQDVPRDQPVLVTAEIAGFLTQTRSVTVPRDATVRLNFSLEPEPMREGHVEVQKFDGLLPCQARLAQDGGGSTTQCGSLLGQERNDIWEFAVGPDLAGIVFEVFWDPATALSTILNVTIETVGYGDSDIVMAQVEGPSVLRAQVIQAHAAQYYPDGGIVRARVSIGTDADEEAGSSAGVAVNQDFQVIASTFYVEPPDPTYTVQDA